MGTRSVIAVPTGPNTWQGRYVHWDGYPSGVGESVREIVARDGYTAAIKTLTEDHYGWSSVDGRDQPTLGAGYSDGRFAAVPGYGVAYTTEQDQSREDEWVTPGGGDWGTEWAYVLGESGITVLERRWSAGGHAVGMFGFGASDTEDGGTWVNVGQVRYDDEEGMSRVEEALREASAA